MRKCFVLLYALWILIGTTAPATATDSTSFDPTTIPISTQSSDSGVPVGTIVAWPSATLPAGMNQAACVSAASDAEASEKGCEWLICDGSTIKASAYPELSALVGKTLPDYRGVFLRGHGSQTHTKLNGTIIGNTSTTHSSGALGELQGDALRKIEGRFGGDDSTGKNAIGVFTWTYRGSQYSNGAGGGGAHATVGFDSSRIAPTANEVRPINRAVLYLVKAR